MATGTPDGESKPLTVGDIRKAIEGLPDDALCIPTWSMPPGENDPSVGISGFRPGVLDDAPYLGIHVFLEHLNDDWEYEDGWVDADHPAVIDGLAEYDGQRAADGLPPYKIVQDD